MNWVASESTKAAGGLSPKTEHRQERRYQQLGSGSEQSKLTVLALVRSFPTLVVVIVLGTFGLSHFANAASVTFAGEIANTGPSATIAFGSLGYDLYATAPEGSAADIFIGAAFQAGQRLTKLPRYVTSITAPRDVGTASAAAFPDYSIVRDPLDSSRMIRAGFETTHAPNGYTSVPLVDINLGGASPPLGFFIGFMTNVHAGRPDDYPSTITVAIGNSAATAITKYVGAEPDGNIDVYFFYVRGAQPGDQIVVEASQRIRNPSGGSFNPSVAGLLFSLEPPPAGFTIQSSQLRMPLQSAASTICTQDRAIRGSTGSTIRIDSGTGSFASVSGAHRGIKVAAGQLLFGTITLAAHNGFVPSAVVPMIGTTSWGTPQRSWWLINHWLPTGNSTSTTEIRVVAPSVPGEYWLIFAFQGELRGDQVASGTNWGVGHDVWGPDHGVASLSAAQIAQAQHCGFTEELRLYRSGYQQDYLAAAAAAVQVTSGIPAWPATTQQSTPASPAEPPAKALNAAGSANPAGSVTTFERGWKVELWQIYPDKRQRVPPSLYAGVAAAYQAPGPVFDQNMFEEKSSLPNVPIMATVASKLVVRTAGAYQIGLKMENTSRSKCFEMMLLNGKMLFSRGGLGVLQTLVPLQLSPGLYDTTFDLGCWGGNRATQRRWTVLVAHPSESVPEPAIPSDFIVPAPTALTVAPAAPLPKNLPQ